MRRASAMRRFCHRILAAAILFADAARTRPTARELARSLPTHRGSTLPAEELLLLTPGGDYGWPECYYDDSAGESWSLRPSMVATAVNAPVCAQTKSLPVAAFSGTLGAERDGTLRSETIPGRCTTTALFIAFHGSWDRAPYPQGGYNVVFQPLNGDHASGGCEIFADGFAGAVKTPEARTHRPSGVAVGPDGSLYVSDDVRE